MSAGRVTIRDVAAAAGVSRQTVSNALIHPERLKGPTLERVQAVIRELGYRPSNAAQSLRSQRTGAVGFELLSYGEANRNEVAYPFTVALGEMARRVRAARHDFLVDLDRHLALAVTAACEQAGDGDRVFDLAGLPVELDLHGRCSFLVACVATRDGDRHNRPTRGCSSMVEL